MSEITQEELRKEIIKWSEERKKVDNEYRKFFVDGVIHGIQITQGYECKEIMKDLTKQGNNGRKTKNK